MHDTFSTDGAHGQPLDWQALAVEPLKSAEGRCDCCGTATRRVWGAVSQDGGSLAAYYVGWTVERPDHGARFELVVGSWGEEADAGERAWVELEYRLVDGEGAFMVVDAAGPDDAKAGLAATALRRDDVIGTPLAPQVFAIVDAVIMKDARLEELRGWR